MAVRQNTGGDDTYDKALQRTMHTVLPPILTEIADKRPADPIRMLSERLYQYRENEDKEDSLTSTTQEKSSLGTARREITGEFNNLVIKEATPGDMRISQSQVSYIDDRDFTYTNAKLHGDVISIFHTIGDLFDESDIT